MRAKLMLTLAAFGGALQAQNPVLDARDQAAGFGAYSLFNRGALDVQTLTRSNLLLGVEAIGPFLYVTGRGNGATTTAPHTVYVISRASGALIRQFAQTGTASSTWGWRDMATDGKSLICGSEAAIHVIDTAGRLTNKLEAKNGTQTITANPIIPQVTIGLNVARGLAFDPEGNSGNGSIWAGDFGGALFELDLSGKVLKQWPNNQTPGWSIYGIARDPHTKNLWINSAPNSRQLRELDPTTGKYTGRVIERNQPVSAQGGLCGIVTPAPSATGEGFTLLGLDQGTPDAITAYRVDRSYRTSTSIPGDTEAVMVSNVKGGAFSASSPKRTIGSLLNVGFAYDFSKDATLKGRPAVLFINGGPEAKGYGTTPGVEELVAKWAFSVPPALGAIILPGITLQDTTGAVTLPVPAGLNELRMQTLYFEPRAPNNFPFIATNQVAWETTGQVIEVHAIGVNAFNAEQTYGFFSVVNNGAIAIKEIVFDWTKSTVTGHAATEFDTDQGAMGGRFDGGNSTMPTCMGTYRNKADVNTGLVYDNQNTASVCDPTANTGWIGTNAGNNANDWRTVKFRFAGNKFRSGARFEFDCDTDGQSGVGADGAGHAGLPVQITLLNNRVLNGVLAAVGNRHAAVFLK